MLPTQNELFGLRHTRRLSGRPAWHGERRRRFAADPAGHRPAQGVGRSGMSTSSAEKMLALGRKNGAGKSAVMQCAAGTLLADPGTVEVGGGSAPGRGAWRHRGGLAAPRPVREPKRDRQPLPRRQEGPHELCWTMPASWRRPTPLRPAAHPGLGPPAARRRPLGWSAPAGRRPAPCAANRGPRPRPSPTRPHRCYTGDQGWWPPLQLVGVQGHLGDVSERYRPA